MGKESIAPVAHLDFCIDANTARRRTIMRHNRGNRAILRSWWILALRGLLAILFGLVALFVPGLALLTFIAVFVTYAIIDGIVAVIVAMRERGHWNRWQWVLVGGVLNMLAGTLAMTYPGITALMLLYIIAAWAILIGIGEVVVAFTLREYLVQEWALILAGVFSLVFGTLLFAHPGAGVLSLLWLIGIYNLLVGVLFIVRAFQLRSWSSLVIAQTR
jgi:uncharacterized membrane protein HdeD (DUF308 family)